MELALQAAADGADLVLFPELCLSSYAIDDLHLQDALLDRVEAEVGRLIEASADLPVMLPGAPLRVPARKPAPVPVLLLARLDGGMER